MTEGSRQVENIPYFVQEMHEEIEERTYECMQERMPRSTTLKDVGNNVQLRYA
jgi:hypothetical protein